MRANNRAFRVVSFVLAIGALIAWVSTSSGRTPGDGLSVLPAATAGRHLTVAELIDDASITAQIKVMLAYDRSTSWRRTTTVTHDGAVTLMGEAKNQAEIDRATEIASAIDGVKHVTNGMTVKI